MIAGRSESYRRYIGTGPAGRRPSSCQPPAGASSRRFGPSRYCRRTARQKRTHHRVVLCATVELVDVSVNVAYETGCATTTSFQITYTDEIMINNMPNGQSFIGDGDSGSLAVDEATAKPVGLLFAAGEASAVANPVADVLSALSAANAGKTFRSSARTAAVPGCSLPGIAASAKVTPQSAAALPPAPRSAARTQPQITARRMMNMKGVSAYGQSASLDAPLEPAVLIFVSPGASHAGIPAEIDGVRTRIVGVDTASVRGRDNLTAKRRIPHRNRSNRKLRSQFPPARYKAPSPSRQSTWQT